MSAALGAGIFLFLFSYLPFYSCPLPHITSMARSYALFVQASNSTNRTV